MRDLLTCRVKLAGWQTGLLVESDANSRFFSPLRSMWTFFFGEAVDDPVAAVVLSGHHPYVQQYRLLLLVAKVYQLIATSSNDAEQLAKKERKRCPRGPWHKDNYSLLSSLLRVRSSWSPGPRMIRKSNAVLKRKKRLRPRYQFSLQFFSLHCVLGEHARTMTRLDFLTTRTLSSSQKSGRGL